MVGAFGFVLLMEKSRALAERYGDYEYRRNWGGAKAGRLAQTLQILHEMRDLESEWD